MKDRAIQIIEKAIQEGWKRIHLRNLDLHEVPILLAEIPDLEVVDLRGNNLGMIPEWLQMIPDFETIIDNGFPKNKTVYLHGNRFISTKENVVVLIRSEKIANGLFEMILSHFDSNIQQVDCSFEVEEVIYDENGNKTFQKQIIEETYPNQWNNNVILQKGNALLKLVRVPDKAEIQVIIGGVDGSDSNWLLSRLFEYVNSIESKQGIILHFCPFQNCQKHCVDRYLFDFKYLEGFHKKYLPKIQCYESGKHLRLDNFSGLTQPVVQIFIEYSNKDEKSFAELCDQFPMEGWDYDANIWHHGLYENIGSTIELEYENNFRRSEVTIFLISSSLTSDKKSYKLLKEAKKRWQVDGILLIPIVVSPCFWKHGLEEFEGEELPEPIMLSEGDWHKVSFQVHNRIEKWLKNQKNN